LLAEALGSSDPSRPPAFLSSFGGEPAGGIARAEPLQPLHTAPPAQTAHPLQTAQPLRTAQPLHTAQPLQPWQPQPTTTAMLHPEQPWHQLLAHEHEQEQEQP
jgi:hypothetical protein